MSRTSNRPAVILNLVIAAVCWAMLGSCRSSRAGAVEAPSIEFSRIPPVGDGSSDKVETIEGRVRGARPGDRIVLFALSGVWWVQPLATDPFTTIRPDAKWSNTTHPGSVYAAVLVDARYRPPLTVRALPQTGGPVLAVARVDGAPPSFPDKTLEFSGYQWIVRHTSGDQGGSINYFDPSNAWVDRSGFLHLRISRHEDHWTSAEVTLSRSLGYGSYRFVTQDVSHLEPAAVFAMFTWDGLGPSREMDIELTRWGEPEDKNAQYVIQPYLVPANTVRFNTPAGRLTHWIDWEPGRVFFRTARGSSSNPAAEVVAEHRFTSGVPSPGDERIRMNVYVYGNKRNPLQHETEVIIEKFEFLP
jgi:hypothetical protein